MSKKKNDPQTIQIYNEICEYYFILLDELIPQLEANGHKIKTEKDERAIFKFPTKAAYKQFVSAWERAFIKDEKVSIQVGSFSCSFWLSGIMDYKKRMERLITRKHHRYYIGTIRQPKAA